MNSLIYFFIVLIVFLIVYVCVNIVAVTIFNIGKREFPLKPVTKLRLADNYIYTPGNDTDTDGGDGGIDGSAPRVGSLNCNVEERLIECDIDERNELGVNAKCAQCKQVAAKCVNISQAIYSSSNPDEILIPANSSSSKGYCLPSVTTSTSCTRRFGGKWILTKVATEKESDIVYTFQCYCSTPNFFQNASTTETSDCTRFVGCRNGKLIDSPAWTSYETMRCQCPSDMYEEKYGSSNVAPTCIPLNVYRRKYSNEVPPPFEILDPKYVEPRYKSLISSSKISLPNPCSFDVTTKTFVKNIGRLVWTGRVAYCESINSNYMPVIINDDYLKGNGGKYANAMFRFRIQDASTERNDDPDDKFNRYSNGKMYEVFRTGSAQSTLAGVRVPYSNFPIYLPYLESDSYNMNSGIAGQFYRVHPVIPAHRHAYAMVYIFEANTPNYQVKMVLGSTLEYIPAFMSTSVDSRYRVYNGVIPCVNVASVNASKNSNRIYYRLMYPIPPANKFSGKLGTKGIFGPLISPNENSDKFTSTYGFSIIYNGKIQPYSSLFTGTIFSYTLDNRVYTRPVSCGDIVLTQKYRNKMNRQWRSAPPNVSGINNDELYQFARTERDTHLFTRNSYDVEINEVGTPKSTIAHFSFNAETKRLEFKTFYP